MIIWSGWGFLVAIIAFGMSFGMELFSEALTGDDRTCVDCGGRLQPALGRLKAAPTIVKTRESGEFWG